MKTQKYTKLISKFASSGLFTLIFDRISVGDIANLVGIRFSDRFSTITLSELGSLEDVQSVVKAISECDINYVGVDNSVLKNLYELATVKDLILLKVPLFDKFKDHAEEPISKFLTYELALEMLTVILTPKVGKE